MTRKRTQSPSQSPTPAPNRGRVKKRPSDGDEITLSQQMLATHPISKKARGEDKETKQLQAKVAGDQHALRALLQQRLGHADKERTRRRDDIAAIILNSLVAHASSTGDPNHVYTTYPGTAIALNPLFASITEIIHTSKGLVTQYDRIETIVRETAQDNSSKESITEASQQEVKETKRILDLGHIISLRDVKKLLGADDGDEGIKGAGEGGGDGKGKERMTEVLLQYELLNALSYAERGVKRMVKGLPRNSEID